VWSARNAVWVANIDGSDQRRLLSGSAAALSGALPQGIVSSPDTFAAAGTTVLLLGTTHAFAPADAPLACGQGCADSFALRAGTLTDLGPAPGPLAQSAYYEAQPRITAAGEELFSWTLETGLAAGSAASATSEVAQRPIPDPGDLGAQWSDTRSALEPAAGFDAAPDPADASIAAWVVDQGCTKYTLGGRPVCQYAVEVGGASDETPATSIYDDEYTGGGQAASGPTSLDWSADGSQLLMVDPNAPPAGIYEFAANTPATASKTSSELLAQPAGWTFGQARFAGSLIVFDAHQRSGATQTGDIFTIPANCTAATCSFPGSATNISNNPAADASDPSWTSATAPIAAFDGVVEAPAGSIRVTRLALAGGSPRADHALTLLVTLSARATIVVTVARRTSAGAMRTLGSLSLAGAAGPNRVRITAIAGQRLGAARYRATVRAKGSTARPATVSFSVSP